MKKTVLPVILITLIIGYFFVRINTTDSLPQTLFFKINKDAVEKGDYVTFRHPLYQEKLVKRVSGKEGDVIDIKWGELFINEQSIGKIRETSLSGTPLTPIDWKEIPEGYLFVKGDHPDSYDSRYREFGLLKKEEILEVLWWGVTNTAKQPGPSLYAFREFSVPFFQF